MSFDDWNRELYKAQENERARRNTEAAQLFTATIDHAREVQENILWWQRFGQGMDQQAEEARRAVADFAREQARQQTVETFRASRDLLHQRGHGSNTWNIPNEVALPQSEELAAYVRAFHGRFSDNEGIRRLWEEAAVGAGDWNSARKNFWRRINTGDSDDADFVRGMLTAGGYELRDGTRAPILRMEGYDVDGVDAGRRAADLLLTIDHIKAQRKDATGQEVLAATNLRFMQGRDNSTRGDRADERERVPLSSDAVSANGEREQQLRERVGKSLNQRSELLSELNHLVDLDRQQKETGLWWRRFYRGMFEQDEAMHRNRHDAERHR